MAKANETKEEVKVVTEEKKEETFLQLANRLKNSLLI